MWLSVSCDLLLGSGSDSKVAVTDALLEVATRWASIGLLLGIPYDRIDAIEDTDDLDDRVSKLVKIWIVKRLGNSPSWKSLVTAIASKAGGDNLALAKRIASEHSEIQENGKRGDTCT